MVGRSHVPNMLMHGGNEAGSNIPPPSTIAAQLVKNHAEFTRGSRSTDDSTTFRQLLQEILSRTSAPENDIEVNHKLIQVVVEAGLDVLLQDNPFANWDVLLPQAIDSLAVVKSTIDRQPEVLLFEEPCSEHAQRQPHLLLWLLPKLLSLSRLPKTHDLWHGICSLLVCMVSNLSKTLDFWRYSHALLEAYRDCVGELMSVFIDPANFPRLKSTETTLPSRGSMMSLWPPAQQAIVLPPGCQMHVKDDLSRIRVVLILLSAIIEILRDDQSTLRLEVISSILPGWASEVISSVLRSLLNQRDYFEKLNQFTWLSVQTIQLYASVLVPHGYTRTAPEHTSPLPLVRFCQAISAYITASCKRSLPIEVQHEIGVAMRTILDVSSSYHVTVAEEILLPQIHTFVSEESRFRSSSDVMIEAMRIWLLRLPCDVPVWVTMTKDQQGDTEMADSTSGVIRIGRQEGLLSERRWRLRKHKEIAIRQNLPSDSLYPRLIHQLTSLLSGNNNQGLGGLSQSAVSRYATLSEMERETVWRILALCACAATGCLTLGRCTLCDKNPRLLKSTSGTWDDGSKGDDWKEIYTIIKLLCESIELQRSSKHRVLAVLAVRSFIMHTVNAEYLDISNSFLAEWCLRCLHSSLKELRIAAGRTLVAFLRTDLPKEMRDENRRLALDFLRTLSARDPACHHETLILTWGQVAIVCGEKELNLALLRLVDYLGHTNSLVCALAFSELESVAECLSMSSKTLVGPYFRSIAVSVVQDLNTKPQKIQQLSDFLEMSVSQFLVHTQQDTIPFLVLTEKKDVLQRIASARNEETTIQDLILSPPANLAAVLSFLLAQPSSDIEHSTMSHLTDIAPGIRSTDLTSLIRLDPVLVACELLKKAADEDESDLAHIYHVIQQFAVIAERQPGQSRASGKPTRMMASFFEAHVLGIMTAFTNTIEHTALTLSEKIRCIRAIEQMIKLARTNITVALPQIRACLQSAAEQGGLQDAAISAWISLVATLEGPDVVDLVDQTFALVVQHWGDLSSEVQQAVYDSIGDMLKSHSNLIREKVISIPSLASIPLMTKFESEIQRLKEHEIPETHLRAFVQRLSDDNICIVTRALHELGPWLEKNQSYIHEATVSEQPKAVISHISRALLDVCTTYASHDKDVVDLAAQCMGIIGCLDPNRIEVSNNRRQMLVLSNFEKASEVIDWVAIMLEDIIVPAFKSTTDTRAQGFLAWVMQELVRFCDFNEVAAVRLRASQASPAYVRWMEMPESVRNTLTPFLSSRYFLNANTSVEPDKRTYPVFEKGLTYSYWLRTWVYDMLWRGKGINAKMVFPVLARIARGHDLSGPKFLLPYVALNIVVGGTQQEAKDVAVELYTVLSTESDIESEKETLRQCSEVVFAVLDYMSRWVQERKRLMTAQRTAALRAGHSPSEFDEAKDAGQIASVEGVIQYIPADIIARRASECGSYARALYHWEQYMRAQRDESGERRDNDDASYQRLHAIYAHIDEPDGLDGISAHLNILSPEQQAFQHRRAGRWSAAQSWYEIELNKTPADENLQTELLSCLRESGQFDQVLHYASSFERQKLSMDREGVASLLPFVTEALWSTGRLNEIKDELEKLSEGPSGDFNTGVARVLCAMKQQNSNQITSAINKVRDTVTKTLTAATASSLQSCHDVLLRLHAIYEVEALSGVSRKPSNGTELIALLNTMDKRLAVVGSYISDKQYLLSIRRAVMSLSETDFTQIDIGSSWLTTARLARKANVSKSAHYAVLSAFQCGDDAGKIEHARLLWRDGQHRQAIQSLEGAIASGVFATYDKRMENASHPEESQQKQNMLSARAHLLLAKWLDASGQTKAADITIKYQYAAKHHSRWEKGHYYLGKHYNKLLEAEKSLPHGKQSDAYVFGEMSKLVIENYIRSVPFGSKYWYQTIPKIITLWLDLGMDCMTKARGDAQTEILERRNRFLDAVHKQLKKYLERIPPYIFYNALPQMVSRISHPNPKVYEVLSMIISRIVSAHPSQALWGLLAVVKSSSPDRASRGADIINKLKDPKSRAKSDLTGIDLRTMITQGQKLSDGLLQACDIHIESRSANVSLSKDLSFNHKLAPSSLVIPLESTLIANTPAVQDAHYIRKFVAFAQDKVTIAAFSDDVLVLSSLQRPRKLSVRGSDGKWYGLLCKPKDDLRKDQRLMEFNTMINRALKRDAETSKRRLYIKTYGVTPLSEESGTIEWVEGIKPLRDILLKLYQRKGIQPNYNQLRVSLTEASASKANVKIFTDEVLKIFPPILYEWFAEMFPEPDTWFAARIRYARSAAVMSMVGHVLGLGDRHGENILLQEGTGGVFHVDFNCLFDKGLTFEKPELVPFRLTHNMVDAMGAYGYNGPFRKSAELTLGLLRQHQDTLMNILETFVYDPTTDFVGRKKRTIPGVPETPQEVLDSVSSKLRGLLKGESVPLSVEGHVDALIAQATDPWHLCQMYIGWCAFL